jgi:hypothetical protein
VLDEEPGALAPDGHRDPLTGLERGRALEHRIGWNGTGASLSRSAWRWCSSTSTASPR